jgi:CyaY protein
MTRLWRSGNIAPSRPSTLVTESRNMKDAEFKRQFDATLLAIEQAIENSDADIEFETANDILTLEFPNRSKIIINAQSAVRQLWVAARSGGFHYDFDTASGTWRSHQTGAELFAELSRLASEQAGEAIRLA